MIYTYLGPNEAYEIDFIIEYEMIDRIYPQWWVEGVAEVRVKKGDEWKVVTPSEKGKRKIRKISKRLKHQDVLIKCCVDYECIVAQGAKEYMKEDYE